MKIYFAGAIRGGREYVNIYEDIIIYLNIKGHVLTEHVGNKVLNSKGETSINDNEIYTRDIKWIKSADVLVAEVSIPSLGVGYELGIAEKMGIPILCLYRKEQEKNLSAMITGNKHFFCREYYTLKDAHSYIDVFFNDINKIFS